MKRSESSCTREDRIRIMKRIAEIVVRASYDFLEREERAREIAEEFNLNEGDVLLLMDALDEVRSKFPGKSDSWYVRAVLRVLSGVKRVRKDHWIVPGSHVLGDYYPYYNVVMTKDGKYTCDCHVHAYGYVRKSRICTHIAAVMVYRRVGVQLKLM